ncbi:hypothetical protein GGTG_11532 [Gaeumannomyces tritici R3-111a-1]|uniref:Uncharacterized protein n=1 Tax=Gaeumannomyces tritici (strain R3-111a-1) TaxID=644352 RepID=J3PDG1_GAET3|nr:hypothetical protein GGTG_11532 [Gaeumannomyces tritici R3-111a-1]EJT70509.1 hypothetical protein GGTG_11532 [Gaeumannomyces tritici R3-111a-1]
MYGFTIKLKLRKGLEKKRQKKPQYINPFTKINKKGKSNGKALNYSKRVNKFIYIWICNLFLCFLIKLGIIFAVSPVLLIYCPFPIRFVPNRLYRACDFWVRAAIFFKHLNLTGNCKCYFLYLIT